MPVTKAYTTEARIEKFLNATIASGEADEAINEAVDLIDRITGRNFIADTTASERLFDGNDTNDLPIDECVDVTLVKRGLDSYGDNTETVSAGGSTGYYKKSNNAAERGVPFRMLHLRTSVWLSGLQNQKVTAKWGYSASCPAGITLAATVLAAGIYSYNRGGSGAGTIKSEHIGDYSVTYEDSEGWDAFNRAKKILETYTKPRL